MLAKPAFAVLLLSVLMSGCSPLRVLSSVSPIGPNESRRDIPFGGHQLALDVYSPDQDTVNAASRPVIVFLYGGSQRSLAISSRGQSSHQRDADDHCIGAFGHGNGAGGIRCGERGLMS